MRALHKLSDTTIRNFKSDKEVRLSDGGGLYLKVHPSGRKVWTYMYRKRDGKLKSLTIGEYPGANLSDARKRAAEMRDSVAAGNNPESVREREEPLRKWAEIVLQAKADGTKDSKPRAPATVKRDRVVLGHVLALIGDEDIRALTTSALDDALREIPSDENRYRCRYLLDEIFKWACFKEVIKYNVAHPLDAVHKQPESVGYAALLDPKQIGKLLKQIQAHKAQANIDIALELLLRTAVRQGELRAARWSWLDLDRKVLALPKDVTKTRVEREVFLSKQSVKLFRLLQADRRAGTDLIFPAARSVRSGPPGGKSISEMSLNRVLQRMGYTSAQVVPHGFRKTFSTRANESGLHRPDVVEAALGHLQHGVRAIYNKAVYEKEQRALMQWWSDELDSYLAWT